MLIGDYRKAYPKHWESYDSWFTPELFQTIDKSEFLDMVMAKIKEEPDNFEFQRTLHDHYMIMKEFRKALEVINNMKIKFPDLAEDLENMRYKELYVDGDIVEERRDFRECFNTKEELDAAMKKITDIAYNPRYSYEDKLLKIKTLTEENPGNLLYLVGLRDCYIRLAELDKAKEVALIMIAKARERGIKEVIVEYYEYCYLKSIYTWNKNCI